MTRHSTRLCIPYLAVYYARCVPFIKQRIHQTQLENLSLQPTLYDHYSDSEFKVSHTNNVWGRWWGSIGGTGGQRQPGDQVDLNEK